MKKIIPIILIIIVIFAGCTASYRYSHNKYRDINFTAQKYVTTGFLNKYKLYKIDKMDVVFSDGSRAIMSVTGLQDKAPHKNVSYKIFLEKNRSGIWKVLRFYKE
jgi:uncharacterized protein YpmB